MFVSTTFEVVAEPARRQMLDLLREGDRRWESSSARPGSASRTPRATFGCFATPGWSSPGPQGQRRVYRLRLGGLSEIERWLAPYRRMWDRSLADLERHLERGGMTMPVVR